MATLSAYGAYGAPLVPVSQILYLHPRQMEVFRAPYRFRTVVAGRRWGKALALDTPIPTPHGWTTMGALKDGDEVFDESGKVCKVVYAHPVMRDRSCYEVEFSDGTKIVADADHLWSTWTHAARKNSRRNPKAGYGPEVLTTKQIADTVTTGKCGGSNHSIPCAGAVQYSTVDLPVDPYLFGAWLGDGHSDCAAITSGAEDVCHFVKIVSEQIGGDPALRQDTRSGAWRIGMTTGRGCDSGIQKKLRALNVLNNKHVPRLYMQTSVEQRMALFQGLMDTDGSAYTEAGNCELTSVNETLAKDALELALSLGIKATMIKGCAKLNGREVGDKWRIKFSTDMPVFRLKRKLDRMPKERRFRIDHRFIRAVRPVTSVPVRCITVDSPNSLYLCSRSFIPTHNTQLAKIAILTYARGKNRLIWYVAPSYRMAKQIMWPELLASIPKKWLKKSPNETSMTITLKNGTRIELKGADNPDSLRGVGIHFLVMDEAQDIAPDAWYKVLRPTLASTGGHAMFIGTPKSYNFLHDLYVLGQRGEHYLDSRGVLRRNPWKSWQFPTITSPFIPEEEIEAARADMDEKSFRQEFEASFESMSGRVYYPFERKTHLGTFDFNPDLPLWVGQDFNIDPMSSCIMQPQENGDVLVVDEISLSGSNTTETVNELERRYWKQRTGTIIFPDPAGQYRQHARGESDLDIFREREFKRLRYRKKHPAVADRVNSVNRMLMTGDGRMRLKVDSRRKHTIESLEQTMYKEGGREIDKKPSIEHMTDAMGYCIERQFPTRKIKLVGVSI